ncbi:hypothetical protein PAAG_02334 [Paracoccidioides lutzii Pb01]|uniref:Uncharacterized protein n=1 Tax=Paracoccidioides lutzii (strain ATCC MYA-826 / Pb01) TaxID=502779 RepID=C1GUL1_PARBA|nr:hypothetical protein PAAG_02334 [Paracoccidioides lutzii Pb01]EEH40279.1 hypothetical protein PAAG_02334 [Paracoccidioides lutzii Pb01]
MFSVILPSRPCLTNVVPIQSDPTTPATNFAFTFSAAPKFSHIVIFLLPGVTLPANTAAAVYIQFPPDLLLNRNSGPENQNLTATSTPTSASPNFKFLGAIANEKPSAIFKVNFPGPRRRTEAEEEDDMLDEGATRPLADTDINPNATFTLGVSIEPAQNVAAMMANLQNQLQPSLPSTTDLVRLSGQQAAAAKLTPQVSTKILAQRIIGNAFNYLASFAASDPRAGGEEVVPLRAFRDWWTKFERRIDTDPGFLEKGDGV